MKKTLLAATARRQSLCLTVLLALFLTHLSAQNTASSYLFTGSAETYTEITGGTVIAAESAGHIDGGAYSNNALPFSFVYRGAGYNAISIASDGFIAFGTTVSNSSLPISGNSTTQNVAVAFARDLEGIDGAATTDIRLKILGTAPNRTAVIQWKGFQRYTSGTTANGDNLNFQIRLEETTNIIRFVYNVTSTNTTSVTVQIGLKGGTSSDNHNRTTTSNWAATTKGTLTTASCTYSSTILPASGYTFKFAAPDCSTVTLAGGGASASASTVCSGGSTSVTLAGASSASGLSYLWEQSTNAGVDWTAAANTNNLATYTATPTVPTRYRCGLTCSLSIPAPTSITGTATGDVSPVAVVGGTTTVSANPACLGADVTLSTTGTSTGAGQTFQWESSPNGMDWADIAGATLSSRTVAGGNTATTHYRLKVSCGMTSEYSTPLVVMLASAPTYTALPYAQTFEGTWADNCSTRDVPEPSVLNSPISGNASWRRDDDGASGSWTSLSSYAYTPAGALLTARSARFHSGSTSAGIKGTLSFLVDCSASSGANEVAFWNINTSGSDLLKVFVSTDGGANFTQLGTNLGVTAAWTLRAFGFTSTSATTIVKFEATADFGSTDIGLDEVKIRTSGADVGVSALVAPTTSSCPSSAATVTVKLKNFSTSILDLALTPVTITTTATGVNPATFSPVVVNTGTIAAGATQDVVISTTHSMSNLGASTFSSVASVTGDIDATNDAMPAAISTVSKGAITSAAAGDWNDLATWAASTCGTTSIPSAAEPVTIGHAVTVNGAAACAQLTIATAGTISLTGGALSVGRVATGGNAVLQVSNGGTLTLADAAGVLNVAGRVLLKAGSTFNMSAGSIYIDPNDGTAAGSVASGSDIFEIGEGSSVAQAMAVTGGSIYFLDPPFAGSANTVSIKQTISNGFYTWVGSLVHFGFAGLSSGNITTSNYRVDGFVNSSRLLLGDVRISSAVPLFSSSSTSNGSYVGGNLTVDAGSELTDGGQEGWVVAGNVINNGTITTSGSEGFKFRSAGITTGTTIGETTSPNAQAISGAGVWRNSSTARTADVARLVVANTNPAGVTIPQDFQVSGTLELVAGKMNMGTNTLTVGTSAASTGTITTTAGWVMGKIKKWLGAATGTQTLAVGNGANGKKVAINFTTAPTTGGTLTGEFKMSAPGGVAPTGIEAISDNGYWSVEASGITGGTYTITADATGLQANAGGLGSLAPASLRLLKRSTSADAWALEAGAQTPTALTAVAITGLTSFSEFAIGAVANGVLPVEFNYIKARNDGNSNLVEWATASERNTKDFLLERSNDGARNWEVIEARAANGNIQKESVYSARDNAPSCVSYYRLRARDRDAKETVSEIVSVSRACGKFAILNSFPNPTNGFTEVSFEVTQDVQVSALVFDIMGRTVANFNFDANTGLNKLPIDLSSQASGTYTLVLSDGTNRKVQRIVKK
jgi:hypothetical protein